MALKLSGLLWIDELIFESKASAEWVRKPMFGGYAYYFKGMLVIVLMESPGEKSYRGQKYDFEIWNGVLFPVEWENQANILKKYPHLLQHPVLKKWLYWPQDMEGFDSGVEEILREMSRGNVHWGIVPGSKVKKRPSASEKKAEVVVIARDDRGRPRPSMFDEPQKKPKNEKQITDMKNLGPKSKVLLERVGIKTPQQLRKVGWKVAITKMAKLDSSHIHQIWAQVLIGAIEGKVWHEFDASEKAKIKEFLVKLRATLNSKSKSQAKGKEKVARKVVRKQGKSLNTKSAEKIKKK
jgi:hypothetical protein